MIRILNAVVFSFLFMNMSSQACTVFESPFTGDTRYAHNVDWYNVFPNVRGALFTNPANLQKHGELFGASIPAAQWVSKYNSVTFSIAGAEFPVSGFNEKGLSMAILELAQTAFPPANDPRPAFGVSQFVQYNLDNSVTLDDVIDSGKMYRPFSSFHMHYFVCDSSKKCAVIQYIAGEMKVYRDDTLPYPVLTNSAYPDSAAAAKACVSDANQCSPKDNSLLRFANAAKMRTEMASVKTFEADAFSILDTIAQIGPDDFTRFQMMMDPSAQTIKIRKKDSGKMANLKVNFEAMDCRNSRQMIVVDESLDGDISDKWVNWAADVQSDMAAKMGYPGAMAAEAGKYPTTLTCMSSVKSVR